MKTSAGIPRVSRRFALSALASGAVAPSEKFVFEQFAVALFLTKHARPLSAKAKEQLRATGLDIDKPLMPAYPATVIPKWLEVAAEELHPGLPRAEAYRRIGRTFLEGWQETLLGRAAAGVLKVIGPKRTLQRLDRAFRTGDNFIQTEAEELGPTKMRIRFNDVSGVPDYYAGILEQGSVLTNAKNGRVTVESHDRPGATILVEWDE